MKSFHTGQTTSPVTRSRSVTFFYQRGARDIIAKTPRIKMENCIMILDVWKLKSSGHIEDFVEMLKLDIEWCSSDPTAPSAITAGEPHGSCFFWGRCDGIEKINLLEKAGSGMHDYTGKLGMLIFWLSISAVSLRMIGYTLSHFVYEYNRNVKEKFRNEDIVDIFPPYAKW